MNQVISDYGLAKAKGGEKHLDQIQASLLATRLELLRNTLRPTPHVQLAMKGMDLFARLEYVNPIGSIKDRAAYWILRRAAERGEIGEETTVLESSSGNFAAALAAFTHLVGLRFIPVIDPNISGTYESFLRRICPTVVKVEDRDDTGGFLKTRLPAFARRMVRRRRRATANLDLAQRCGGTTGRAHASNAGSPSPSAKVLVLLMLRAVEHHGWMISIAWVSGSSSGASSHAGRPPSGAAEWSATGPA